MNSNTDELTFLFRRATVHDGTATTPEVTDVGVAGERIALVGRVGDIAAHEVIDCRGLALAPGFIDIHGHSDHLLLAAPHAESKALQGVTTEVGGNCGESPAPAVETTRAQARVDLADFGIAPDWDGLGEFLGRLERGGIGVNFACLVGFGNLRAKAMGYEPRPASPTDVRNMQRLAAQALREGAVGLSSGLIYPPQMAADATEVGEVCQPVARAGGFYATHLRTEGARLLEAMQEALEAGRRGGCAVHFAHHKVTGEANWGLVERSLEVVDLARAVGMDVTADVYPYTATSTYLYLLLPQWVQQGGAEAAAQRLREPQVRARAADELAASTRDWERIRIASVAHEDMRWAQGLEVPQLAQRLGVSEAQAVIELVMRDQGHAMMVRFAMSEADVERVLRHPAVMIGSDAAARATAGPLAQGKPHPRCFGTFPRVLGHYVRERRILGLGEAIRKMTRLPARRLGLEDRGIIRTGAYADLVLFDPATVADRATYDHPLQPPAGIVGVWVNGRAVARDGALTGALPGRVLHGRGG